MWNFSTYSLYFWTQVMTAFFLHLRERASFPLIGCKVSGVHLIICHGRKNLKRSTWKQRLRFWQKWALPVLILVQLMQVSAGDKLLPSLAGRCERFCSLCTDCDTRTCIIQPKRSSEESLNIGIKRCTDLLSHWSRFLLWQFWWDGPGLWFSGQRRMAGDCHQPGSSHTFHLCTWQPRGVPPGEMQIQVPLLHSFRISVAGTG